MMGATDRGDNKTTYTIFNFGKKFFSIKDAGYMQTCKTA